MAITIRDGQCVEFLTKVYTKTEVEFRQCVQVKPFSPPIANMFVTCSLSHVGNLHHTKPVYLTC